MADMEDGPLPHFLLGVSIALVVIFSGEVLTGRGLTFVYVHR